MTSDEEILSLWTVYDHPKDMPDVYVARRSEVLRGGKTRMTEEAMACTSLDPIREEMMRRGLICMTRAPTDDPVIVEVWL